MASRRFEVRLTELAARDLDQIAEYVQQDDAGVAMALIDRLYATAASLTVLPRRGRAIPELAQFDLADHRELIVRPYRILYWVEGRSVWVFAVLDSRRRIEDIILRRVLREEC